MPARRFLVRTTSFFFFLVQTALILAQNTFSVGWALSEGRAGLAPTNFNVVTADASNNAYLLALTQSSNADIWTLYKFNPYGGLLWAKNFSFSLNTSKPVALVVDGVSNVYAIGTLSNLSTFVSEIVVEKLSPAGALTFTKTVTDPVSYGISALAAAVDSSNNLYIASAKHVSGGGYNLDISEYSPVFTLLNSAQDTNLSPTHAAFTRSLNVAASGNMNSAYGTEVDLVTKTGVLLFAKTFPDVNGATSVFPQADFTLPDSVAAPLAGNDFVLVIDNILYEKGASASYAYIIFEVDSKGSKLWQTTSKSGTVTGISQNDPNATFFCRSVMIGGQPTTFGACANNTGALSFDKAMPNTVYLGSDWGTSFWATWDPSTNKYQIQALDYLGNVLWTQSPAPGTPLKLYAFDGTFVLGVKPSSPNDLLFLERIVHGLTLQSISSVTVKGGKTISCTATLTTTTPTDLTVKLFPSTNLTGIVTVPSTVTVPAGQKSVTFQVNTTGVNSTVGGYIIGQGGLSQKEGYCLVEQPDLSQVALDSATVTGGQPWGATIDLDGPAGSNGVTVEMTSDHPGFIPDANFKIPSGQTSLHVTGTTDTTTTSFVVTLTWKLSSPVGTKTVITKVTLNS